MKKHKQERVSYPRWGLLLIIVGILSISAFQDAKAAFGTPTKYEAESSNIGNASTASANTGYTGSGYVTGLTSEWSYLSFDKSNPSTTLAKIDIRYANGTGAAVTNLALYVGSTKIQNLSFPTTANWTTWATLSVTFNLPAGYQNIKIDGETNVTTSINIDYNELSLDDGVAAPSVATPTFSPAGGTYTSAQSVTISTTTTGATIYYTQDGSNPTTASTVYPGTAISVSTTKTIKALATKLNMTNSTVGSATYTINIPPPAPGAFTQTAPSSGATGVSTSPSFIWAASSNASSYSLVVSTSASYTSPIINQTGITATSYTSGTALANSTVYYWKVTAVNSTSPTVATNAGLSFTTTAPLPVVATPTFSPVAGTYASAQPVTISSATTGVTIYYTTNGSTPTTASAVYTAAINVGSTQTIKAIATKSNYTNSAVGTAAYTINIPVPAPGAFTQTSPASAATGVSTKPAFSWAASSNAATYALVVSTSNTYTSPVINQTGLTGTSFTPTTALAYNTVYYWKVTATNVTSSTIATNAGLSFTTRATPPPVVGEPGVTREFWAGIAGSTVASLTSNANYPNTPTSSSVLTSFDAPQNVGETYGQRIKGYVTPSTTGSYTFYIAADDEAELWLSTDDNPANKVKIASVSGWTNYIQYTKFASQTSVSKTLTAGNYYYIEALHKENDGGDHCSVAWSGPGVSQSIITSANLVTAPPVPIPAPGAFNLSTPAASATGVSLAPAFTWGASSDAVSYTLVVSSSNTYSNPVINQSGITTTSYTPGGGLSGNTTYYWKVTAVNSTSTTVAANAGRSFTTLTPPAPSAFNQTAPASGATSVTRTPLFTWGAATNATTYSLVVSVNADYSSPLINATGLTSTSYSHSSNLAGSTKYYWKVTAVNSTGPTVATNAGISFTTGATVGTYYYVSTTGVDQVGRGTELLPYRTVAYAAKQVAANQNNTIYINPGTYYETEAIVLPLGVNIEGAGEASVTITSNNAIPSPGVDQTAQDFPLWHEGSIIQLYSPIYSDNIKAPRNGKPEFMIAAQDGNQTISGFTLDGNSDKIKAGLWVVNRNNITAHHLSFKNFKQTGAVFTRGDVDYYVPIPEGKWMKNLKVYNCTFLNSGSDNGQQEGCLKLGGIDGGDIYNITINDNNGEGIKFAHVGHYRNTKIHDCYIRVPESHPAWGEFMSIELWDLSYGNEVYNIDCNTWFSFVNFNVITSYEPTGTATNNLKVYNCKMIDLDGASSKEAIEVGLSGVEVYNNYLQDKGFFVAFWNGADPKTLKKNLTVRNNIFANVLRTPVFGFGNSSAVFVPDAAQNVKVYNNVMDRLGNGLQLNGATGVEVKNNVFINTEGADVENGASLVFNNNLKYHTNAQKTNWNLVGGPTVGTGNVLGNPGFLNTGARNDTYYKPSSSSSFAVNKGTDVGLPYVGTPDIGRWEFGLNAREEMSVAEVALEDDAISSYPNPTTGIIRISSGAGIIIQAVHIMNTQGKMIISKSATELKGGEIDLSTQPSDIYILRVKHQRGIITKKIVLVK